MPEMKSKENNKKTFNGMSYREVQCSNSKRRATLHDRDQQWLKKNAYRNLGWDSVIRLYQKIEDFLDRYKLEDCTLEELFLEADRIGNKYLTNKEIEEFNHRFSQEVSEIAEEIDKQFPDTEIEFIDFTKKANSKISRKYNQKSYRTIKV
jgi:hypothetical protein